LARRLSLRQMTCWNFKSRVLKEFSRG
jgi:hypothetical protein